MKGPPSRAGGPPSSFRPPSFEKWERTASPFLVARVRILGTIYGLLRHVQQCRREADRVRALALRSKSMDARRRCPRCDGLGWTAKVERSEEWPAHPPLARALFSRVVWLRDDLHRKASAKRREPFGPVKLDCGACRGHRLALDAEIAGAAWRARELESWAGAVEALMLEMWPSWMRAIARSRRDEHAAELAEREAERARLRAAADSCDF